MFSKFKWSQLSLVATGLMLPRTGIFGKNYICFNETSEDSILDLRAYNFLFFDVVSYYVDCYPIPVFRARHYFWRPITFKKSDPGKLDSITVFDRFDVEVKKNLVS